MIRGSTTLTCWVKVVMKLTRRPWRKPMKAPPKTTVKKESVAMKISPGPTEVMSNRAIMVLYRTTVTPSLKRDSPNTRKYKPIFT